MSPWVCGNRRIKGPKDGSRFQMRSNAGSFQVVQLRAAETREGGSVSEQKWKICRRISSMRSAGCIRRYERRGLAKGFDYGAVSADG